MEQNFMMKPLFELTKITHIINFIDCDEVLLMAVSNADREKRNLPILHLNNEEELNNVFEAGVQPNPTNYKKDDTFFVINNDNTVVSLDRTSVVRQLKQSPYIFEIPKILAKIGEHYDINDFVDNTLCDLLLAWTVQKYNFLDGYDGEIINVIKENDILLDDWDDLAELIKLTVFLKSEREKNKI